MQQDGSADYYILEFASCPTITSAVVATVVLENMEVTAASSNDGPSAGFSPNNTLANLFNNSPDEITSVLVPFLQNMLNSMHPPMPNKYDTFANLLCT